MEGDITDAEWEEGVTFNRYATVFPTQRDDSRDAVGKDVREVCFSRGLHVERD